MADHDLIPRNISARILAAAATVPARNSDQFSNDNIHIDSTQSLAIWWTLLLFVPIAACGIIGNTFVCIAIYIDKRLQNVTNYFLFSLAVADLLVCTIVIPMTIATELNYGQWYGQFSSCLFYVYADVFLCTTSIVHMCVISLDRYLGISQPLKIRNKSSTVVGVKIFLVWLVTVLISSPIPGMSWYDPTNIYHQDPTSLNASSTPSTTTVEPIEPQMQCFIINRWYMIFGSIFAFLIPFVIMAITYVRTTQLLKQQARLLYSEAASPSTNRLRSCADSPRNGLRRTITSRKKESPRAEAKRSLLADAAANNASPDAATALIDRQLEVPGGDSTAANGNGGSGGQTRKLTPDELKEKSKRSRSVPLSLRDRTTSMLASLARRGARLTNKLSRSAAAQELANEEKATRVLAVVFACFFVCWTPFFVINFLVGFCGDACTPPTSVMTTALWLGYISSTLNPLIYTTFNRRFRQTFARIGKCDLIRSRRQSRHELTKRQYASAAGLTRYGSYHNTNTSWRTHARTTGTVAEPSKSLAVPTIMNNNDPHSRSTPDISITSPKNSIRTSKRSTGGAVTIAQEDLSKIIEEDKDTHVTLGTLPKPADEIENHNHSNNQSAFSTRQHQPMTEADVHSNSNNHKSENVMKEKTAETGVTIHPKSHPLIKNNNQEENAETRDVFVTIPPTKWYSPAHKASSVGHEHRIEKKKPNYAVVWGLQQQKNNSNSGPNRHRHSLATIPNFQLYGEESTV